MGQTLSTNLGERTRRLLGRPSVTRTRPMMILLSAALAASCASAGAPPRGSDASGFAASPANNTPAVLSTGIGEALAEKGFDCTRSATLDRRRLTDSERNTWSTSAVQIGPEGGWLFESVAPLSSGQAFVGTFDQATKAHGGSVVGTGSDAWILIDRPDFPLAIQLVPIELAGDRPAWMIGQRLIATTCESPRP